MSVDPWDVFAEAFPTPPAPERPARPVTYTATPGSGYGQTALEQEVQRVVGAQPGTRNHTLNRAAFSLAQLVAGGVLDETDTRHALTLAAAQAGLDAVETARTIQSGFDAGTKEPRGVPEKPDVESWLNSLPPTVDPETGEVLPPDPDAVHRARVAAALYDLRVKHEATTLHKAELATRQFREPPSRPTLTAELLLPDPPVEYAVEEVLPLGGNALLAAAYKTGKTTTIGDLARAYADGGDFLGRFKVNPGPGRIAIWNYELSESQYRRWLRDLGVVNTDRVVVLHLRGYRLPLTSPQVEDWVVRWLHEHEVTFWVPDPFARAAVGTDENSNTDVGIWLDTLDVIKERAGVRDLVLPTHTGRAEQEAGQERARGATRLDDWADVRWLLTKDKDDNRFFRATGRDVEVEEELLTYDPDSRRLHIGGGDRKWVAKRGALQRVLDYVNANPGCSTRDVSGMGGNKPANESALAELIRTHKVRTEDVLVGKSKAVLHYANEVSV